MRGAARLLAGAALVALAMPGQAVAETERVLTDLVEGRRPLTDLSEVRFSSGMAGFRGRSTLVVSGDGVLRLDMEAAGRTESKTSRLEEDGVRALLRLLLDTRVWILEAPTGPRPRDAVLLTIRLATHQRDVDVEVRFPLTEAAESPDALALVEVYRALEAALLEVP